MLEITPETVIRRIELPGSRIQDEMVFFHHEAGKYYATGPVGADIWERLEAPCTFSAICDHLVAVYDIDRKTCENQVRAFLGQMLGNGMIGLEPR